MYKIIATAILFFITLPAWLMGQNSEALQRVKEGVKLHDQGEYEKAMEKYREALELDSDLIQATYEMSLTAFELGDYANAEVYSNRVIQSGDSILAPGAYALKSELLLKKEKPEEAIELLQRGIETYGDEYTLHFNLGLNYYKQGEREKALTHVRRAIDLDKSHSGSFLLNAYLLKDIGLWVQSILSFQMFLLMEPDSERSKNAFAEMLQTMGINKQEEPVQRSFVQQQLMRNRSEQKADPDDAPPLTVEEELDRAKVYQAIKTAIDSMSKENSENNDNFKLFSAVNQSILDVLEAESIGTKEGVLWTYYVPFFTCIKESDFFETYCRYISVSYYSESLQWWQKNEEEVVKFAQWFENGDTKEAGSKK